MSKIRKKDINIWLYGVLVVALACFPMALIDLLLKDWVIPPWHVTTCRGKDFRPEQPENKKAQGHMYLTTIVYQHKNKLVWWTNKCKKTCNWSKSSKIISKLGWIKWYRLQIGGLVGWGSIFVIAVANDSTMTGWKRCPDPLNKLT